MVRTILASLVFATTALTSASLVACASGLTSPACVFPTTETAQASIPTAPAAIDDIATARAADAETAARVIAGIEHFVARRNAGDFAAYAALLTPNRMLAEAGTTNPDDVVAGLDAFNLPITILVIDDVRVHPDGRMSAEFVHLFGAHLYYRSRIYVIEEDGFVKFDEEVFLPEEPLGNRSTVDVGLVDFAFDLDRTTIPNAPFVVLSGHNDGAVPHEMIVVRLPEGASVEDALSGEVEESRIEFIGQATVAPGESDDLVLVNLDPGTYTLFCFLDQPDGVPHAAMGMVAQFTVEGPATPIVAGS